MVESILDKEPAIPSSSQWEVPEYEVYEYKPRSTRYCLCVFVLNENGRLHKQLAKSHPLHDSIDVVIADGGSTDGSVGRDALVDFNLRAVLKKTGPGKLGAQMRMAFAWAMQQGYEGVVTVDGNNKDDVSLSLSSFTERLDEGYGHLQGSRYIPGGHHKNTPFARHWGVKLLHAPLITLSSGFRYTDTTNGFRAYSRQFLTDPRVNPFRDEFVAYELHYYLAIRAARLGYKIAEVPVSRVYPGKGPIPTKISAFKGNLGVLATLIRACAGKYNPST